MKRLHLLCIAAACLGFLWFNAHPAKVFMGDTGSLSLGGALGTVAVCTHTELLTKKGYYHELYTRQYEDEATAKILA